MKIIYKCLLSISLITLCFSTGISLKYKEFSTHNVIEHIKELSSNKYEGRLAGNAGNVQASEYIKNEMNKNNLKAYNKNFFHTFNVNAPIEINEKPYFKVLNNKGDLIDEFIYGIDFKETFLNFKVNEFNFSQKNQWRIFENGIEILDNNNSLVFSTVENNLNFRSSFFHNNPIDLSIFITKEASEKLLKYKKQDLNFNLYIPYKIENKKANNIIGYIKGKDSKKPPLILSAHFDHLGKDLLGNVYPGALDNASGTGFLLELSRYLNFLPKPNRDIIIVAFNAEEFGFLGSNNFVENNIDIIKNGNCINFDMIGGNEKLPTTFITGDKVPNSILIDSLSKNAKKNNLDYLVDISDSSDHTPFNNNDISAVTIAKMDISNIHTINDKVEFISSKSISETFNIVIPEIIKLCYAKNSFFMYSPFIFYVSLSISFILIILPISLGLIKAIKKSNLK